MKPIVITYSRYLKGKNKGKWKRPDLNTYVLQCRKGWKAGNAYIQGFKDDFIKQIHSQNPPKHCRRVELTFHYYEPDSRRDLDNVEFARKPIQDALVGAGIIPNDNRGVIVGYGKSQHFIDKVRPRVEIFIRDCE